MESWASPDELQDFKQRMETFEVSSVTSDSDVAC